MSNYDPLFQWLQEQRGNRIPMTFGQVEDILHFDLPSSATQYSQWWENNPNQHSHAGTWLDVGFHTEEVNRAAGTVTFVRP